MFTRRFFSCFAVLVLLTGVMPATARIKLVALPVRERVEIQTENPNFTLVEEERIVPLLKSTAETGNNKIDFSWSNTRIRPDSIQFRPIGIRAGAKFRPIKKGEISVINVSYPPGESALIWEIYSKEGCAAKVRVSYLISNLTRFFAYKAVSSNDESTLTLRKYLQLRNFSGEAFGAAKVILGYAEKMMPLRDIGQQEEIKLLMYRFKDVPIKKTYTYDWFTHGPLSKEKPLASKVLMHYNLKNVKQDKLGVLPLEPGKVRIYIQDRRGGEAFLGEDHAALTPVGDTMKLFVGQARDVVVKRMLQFKETRPVQHHLYDLKVIVRYELENFKDEPVTVDIIEQLNRLTQKFRGNHAHGDVEWELGDQTSDEISITYEKGRPSPVLHVSLPARPKGDAKVEKKTVRFHATIKNLWDR